MLIVIGFKDDDIDFLREIDDVYPISKSLLGMTLGDIIEKRPKENYTVVEGRKIVIIHNISRENIKRILGSVREKFGNEVIFATTTPTSLKWKVGELIKELMEEDAYFRKRKN